jgi:hypothetical protein
MVSGIEAAVAAMAVAMISGLLCSRVLVWTASLWECYREYRIAVAYPHLGRRKTLFVFVPLLLLHSGPWLLGLVVFGALELFMSPRAAWHYWFVGGFLAYLLFVALVLRRFWLNRKAAAAAAEKGVTLRQS